MRRRAGGPGRHSIGRRGGAPGGAGPYVTGAAHPGRRARWLARDARAGPFAKDLPREPRKLPWGLANPWRLPALHHPRFGEDGKRGRAYPAPENKDYGRRSVGYARIYRPRYTSACFARSTMLAGIA